jgi:hypothetical protein
MEKEFVPYEQGLVLKELGFDEPCFGFYLSNDKLNLFNDCRWEERTNSEFIHHFVDKDISCVAPTFSQSFRFFREKCKLDGKPEYFLNDWYCFIINDMKEEDTSRKLFTEFPSYEEAELECLKKLIEIVKEQK